MRLTYDRDEDVLLIETVAGGTLDHADQTGPLISHFDRDGKLLLLEILDASEFLASVIKATLRGQQLEAPQAAAG